MKKLNKTILDTSLLIISFILLILFYTYMSFPIPSIFIIEQPKFVKNIIIEIILLILLIILIILILLYISVLYYKKKSKKYELEK